MHGCKAGHQSVSLLGCLVYVTYLPVMLTCRVQSGARTNPAAGLSFPAVDVKALNLAKTFKGHVMSVSSLAMHPTKPIVVCHIVALCSCSLLLLLVAPLYRCFCCSCIVTTVYLLLSVAVIEGCCALLLLLWLLCSCCSVLQRLSGSYCCSLLVSSS